MKLNTNYHTHSHFCDGKGAPELYVISAIEKGMQCLGFSGHSPVPFPSTWNMKWEDLAIYFNEIEQLKTDYKSKIEVYAGLEVDFIENVCSVSNFDTKKLDFFVGSVHYLKQFDTGIHFNFDESAARFDLGLQQIFGGDIKRLVHFYFDQICWMIETHQPPIIGHLDLVKKFNLKNNYFEENEKWFLDAAMPALELAKKHDLIVEINTKGKMKGACKNLYPGPNLLKACQQMDIAITVSADAHKPEDVDGIFDTVELLLAYLNIKKIRILKENKWQDIGIS